MVLEIGSRLFIVACLSMFVWFLRTIMLYILNKATTMRK